MTHWRKSFVCLKSIEKYVGEHTNVARGFFLRLLFYLAGALAMPPLNCKCIEFQWRSLSKYFQFPLQKARKWSSSESTKEYCLVSRVGMPFLCSLKRAKKCVKPLYLLRHLWEFYLWLSPFEVRQNRLELCIKYDAKHQSDSKVSGKYFMWPWAIVLINVH